MIFTDTESVHNEYKPDARKAHDGTIEYTSRDAHIGAHSRRSDLEILAYNLVHWMSGDLPWMDNLGNPDYVHAQKKGYMNDVKAFLSRCFKSEDYPGKLKIVQFSSIFTDNFILFQLYWKNF